MDRMGCHTSSMSKIEYKINAMCASVLKIYLCTCGNQRVLAPRLQLLQGLQKTLVIEFKTVDEKWNDFYDGSQIKPDMTQANEGMAGQILSNGKRAFSNMIIGSARPHKCRKLNHSQNAASSVLNAIVPDFVLQTRNLLLKFAAKICC